MIISVLTPECLQGLLDVWCLYMKVVTGTFTNLHETFQTGFCPLHGSEAALLKLVNDLLLSADLGALITLVRCDLSENSDAVSHEIHLSPLSPLAFQAVRSIGWSPVLGLGSGLFQSTNTDPKLIPEVFPKARFLGHFSF